jgi:Flp pilus assembly protein TadG
VRSRRDLPRLQGDGGAVIVEFALVAPVIALVLLGTIEYGFAWSDANFVERSVQNSGRTAASLGQQMNADYEALRAVAGQFTTLKRAEVDKVVIYESTTADGQVPEACTSVVATGTGVYGVAGTCNVYSPTQVNATNFSGLTPAQVLDRNTTNPTCAGNWDANWCPSTRSSQLRNPDHLGVWVRVNYQRMTGLLPGTFTIERSAVYQVEPELNLGG